MNLSDIFVLAAEKDELKQPGLFPFPFNIHVGFACLALIFFLFQFFRQKKPYQLIMAVAIPLSLAIWLSDNRTFFYAIGIIEAVLLIAALVSSFIFRDKSSPDEQNNASEKAEAPAETETATAPEAPESTENSESENKEE